MFTLQWNIEHVFAPLAVVIIADFLRWVFVQSAEHIKKPIFFVDLLPQCWYISRAVEKGMCLCELPLKW